MSDTHDEVISAFLDDEPFDSRTLAEALSEPAGRDMLVDLVALRHLVRTEGIDASASRIHKPRRSALRALVAVAAILVALVSAYRVGQRRSDVAPSAAPPATRVVPAQTAWQVVAPARTP